MKKINKVLYLILFVIMLTLFGCETVTPISSEITYDFTYNHEGVEVTKEEISLSDFKLMITINDLTSTMDVTDSMLVTGDLSSLQVGSNIVGLCYKDYSEFITVLIKETVGGNEGGLTNNFDMSYYSAANGLGGNDLKLALRAIISVVTHTETYAELRDDLQKTDASLTTQGMIIDFYSHKEMNATWDGGLTWNREHVWPRSKAWYQYEGAGADIHCVRPSDSGDNSSRGNTPFGEKSGYFEPNDCSKGDVARLIFYMLVRYEETDDSLYPITNVAQSMELLLDWNALDPVDDIERQRNEVAYSIQGNRNPFIDYSDYAYYIWDQSRLTK